MLIDEIKKAKVDAMKRRDEAAKGILQKCERFSKKNN